MVKICCVCNRVEQAGSWTYNGYYYEDVRTTHGYCPSCFNEAMAEIERYVAARHDKATRLELPMVQCAACV